VLGRALVRVAVNAVALWVAALLLPGMVVGGDLLPGAPLAGPDPPVGGVEDGDVLGQVVALLGLGAVFGLVNAVIRPVVVLVSLPLYLVTLGFFALVVNALMLLFTEWLAGLTPLVLEISGFWTAVLAGLVVTVVSAVLERLLPDPHRDHRRDPSGQVRPQR
jgi:putative membrane protein